MFQPSDKFYTNIQLNSVIFEGQGVVVHEVVDLEKRKKFVLIERSTSDENEYAELQKDICAFDKSESPFIIKIHKYTYDLVIPESKQNSRSDYGIQQNVFSRNGQSVISNASTIDIHNNKKIYRLSFLTDYFTTNLKLWIEKKREDIDKHNSQFKANSLYSKGNIRKGLPQYEFCSLFHQMVEGINHVYQRELKRNMSSSMKEYVCKVDILAENFVVNESVDLESKIKFIPMHFLSIYNRNYKKRFTTLLDHQEKYAIKRRQTLELQNEFLHNLTTPTNSRKSIGHSGFTGVTGVTASKSRTFSNIVDSDLSSIKSGSNGLIQITSAIQSEDNETKYLRMLFDLGLKLGSLYTGADNFTEPNQPLSALAKQVLTDVCKQYRNVSKILLQMIEPTFINPNFMPSPSYRRPNLLSISLDLKKINDQEYQYDENNFNGPKFNDDLLNDDDQWADEFKLASPKGLGGLLQLVKQSSISNGSTGSFSTIPLANELAGRGGYQEQQTNKLQKQKSLNSQSHIKHHRNSLRRKSSKLSSGDKLSHLELSPNSQTSCQIEIYDIEYLYEKKPKKYKGLAFIIPYTNLLNVIHINEKKNAYMERIEIKQPEKTIIPFEHSIILAPGVGEFKVFILGGEESNQVFEFDSNVDGKITRKANMMASFERRQFGVCMIDKDSKIMVATGIKDEQMTNQCEIYDIATNSWTKINNVNVPLIGTSLCLFNKSSVYKFGGVDGHGKITKFIEKYDIYTDIWKCIQYDIDPYLQQNISFAKNMLSIQINHNQIMIFGGENNIPGQSNSITNNNNVNIYKHIRHPFYTISPTNTTAPNNLNKKIFFCHIDKLGHHELFGIDQYGFIPDMAGYLLPGQVSLSENEVIFFQKQLYRSDTGKLLGFSVDNQVRDVRGTDIRF